MMWLTNHTLIAAPAAVVADDVAAAAAVAAVVAAVVAAAVVAAVVVDVAAPVADIVAAVAGVAASVDVGSVAPVVVAAAVVDVAAPVAAAVVESGSRWCTVRADAASVVAWMNSGPHWRSSIWTGWVWSYGRSWGASHCHQAAQCSCRMETVSLLTRNHHRHRVQPTRDVADRAALPHLQPTTNQLTSGVVPSG